jgi:hypothetical protein
MTQNEFLDYCKKNKMVAFGVPLIVFVLLLDNLVLKPARQKRADEARGATTQSAPANPAVAAMPGAPDNVKTPLAPPTPLAPVSYLPLSESVDSRFAAMQSYPYGHGRNVFTGISAKHIEIMPTAFTDEETEEEAFERPDITYHGFFTVGTDRVAILRFADELLLTKVGGALKRTPFFLRSVFPEKIVISDATESIKEFEISLSDKPKD